MPGQREESAHAYRDKLTMRQYAAAGSVNIPAFAAARSAEDVVRFMRRHGAPVMVKPRLGGGSFGIQRVDNLATAAELTFPNGSESHLVEAFVEGPMFHVDAVCIGGAIVLAVPCAYTGDGGIAHWADAGNGSYTLAPEDPLYAGLIQATARVFDALPGPQNLTLHAEFFVSAGEIVFCEAASRCGGMPIPRLMIRRIGMEMRHLWARLECGLPVDWNAIERHLAGAPLVAGLGLPPRNGQLLELPSSTPAGVEDLQVNCAPGEDFAGAKYAARRSGDYVVTWVVTAEDTTELFRAMDATAASMERSTIWEATRSVEREIQPEDP